MEVLIDTHALIWFIKGDNNLSDQAKTIIESEDNVIYVSIVSIWEIVIKTNIGKLELNKSVDDIFNFLNDNQIRIINILQNHLSTQLLLPLHHRDPFDRLLIAQAIAEDIAIITADQHFKPYPAKVIW